MGQALYRKYRPKKLQDVIGQEHITTALKNSIESGSPSHAYLLTGPRGVGKTSIARILAHEINKIDYDESAVHLDIIEIDAASNRRIDEIRDLRDKVNILPSIVEYKIYIIDEVHMLTREAFNALLKTLEEPPKHVVFILATTEVHKLPDTIISRTQHFSFRPIDEGSLFKHLKKIAESEGIVINDDALQLISIHGDGSFRDSISLLDQTSTAKDEINLNTVQTMLGLAPKQTIIDVIDNLESYNPKQIVDIITQLKDQGVQTSILTKQLADYLRSCIISDSKFQQDKFLKLLEAIINVNSSVNPSKQLEIELLGFIIANNQPQADSREAQGSTIRTTKEDRVVPAATSTPKATISPIDQPSKQPTKEATNQDNPSADQNNTIADKSAKDNANNTENSNQPTGEKPQPETTEPQPTIGLDEFDEEVWNNILGEVKKKYNTLYGVLKMAKVSTDDTKLFMSFKFPFHKKKIDDQRNKAVISQIIKAKTGQDYEIKTVVNKPEDESNSKNNDKTQTISNVSDIFGGGELLES